MNLDLQPMAAGLDLAEAAEALVAGSDGGHFFQYPWWPEIEAVPAGERFAWAGTRGGTVVFAAVARRLRTGGIGPRVLHLERGPVAACARDMEAGLVAVREQARLLGVVSVRAQPYLPRDQADTVKALATAGFEPAGTHFGYDTTLVTRLGLNDMDLLRCFRKGARSAVRQALKVGVEVAAAGKEEAVELDRQYQDMIGRKGATARPEGFLRDIHAVLERRPARGAMLVSRLDGRLLGGIVVLRHGRRALYAFGASGWPEPGLPKTHVLHYEAMRWFRDAGCVEYDFCGFSSGTGQEGDRTPRQNINLFKAGFGGEPRHLITPREAVLRPLWHGLAELARKVRS